MIRRASYSHTEPVLSLERDERTSRLTAATIVGYADKDSAGRAIQSRTCPHVAMPVNEVRE